jgi:pSer/pThr/pTyr-binding forkhead associated (FHA) protein
MLDVANPEGDPPTTSEEEAEWLEAVGETLEAEGHYLVFKDASRVSVVPLTREWTKIGRSLTADIRLDDPTVSRRHALICRQPGGVRVLDDRSLNGIFLNGEHTEWGDLTDGDELLIGRYRLHFVDKSSYPEPADASATTATA